MENKVTNEELLSVIKDLAVTVKNNSTSLEDLAMMTKNGFDAVDHRFDRVEQNISLLKMDVKDIKENQVHRFEFNFLERRVDDTELKLKSAN